MNTYTITSDGIRDIARLGALQAMRELGVTSGELSYRQALKTYGTWFREAVRSGAIRPATQGSRKQVYRVDDILATRAAQQVKGAAQFEKTIKPNHKAI